MQAAIRYLESNDHLTWDAFARQESADPYDDYGWFHVTVGASGVDGSNDFQVCVATPRAVGRARRSGSNPGILVDKFDASSVRQAIFNRVVSVEGHDWDQIVAQLRTFMLWEYEGMSGA